jgi:ribulose-5-phosphate 4-epimerase/fuculose-1-phosphate aldolase
VPDDWEWALGRATDDGRAAADAIRALIRRLDPNVVEVVWSHHGTVGWGVGPKTMSEHEAKRVAALAAR